MIRNKKKSENRKDTAPEFYELPSFQEFRKKAWAYTHALGDLKQAAQNVWIARHLGDTEVEESLKQVLKQKRADYLEKKSAAGLEGPAVLDVHFDSENNDDPVSVSGTDAAWALAAKYSGTRSLDSGAHWATVKDLPIVIGKEITKSYKRGEKRYEYHDKPGIVGEGRAMIFYEEVPRTSGVQQSYSKKVYQTDMKIFERENGTRYCCDLGVDYTDKRGTKELKGVEAVRAREKHITKNPKYAGKIKLTFSK